MELDENLLRENIKKCDILKHFTQKELDSLFTENNKKILYRILKLDSITISKKCVSIIDSALASQRRTHGLNLMGGMQDLKCNQSANNQTTTAQNKYANGLHIFIGSTLESSLKNSAINLIGDLKPWRKGPFFLHFDSISPNSCVLPASIPYVFHIDSEWHSDIKLAKILKILSQLEVDLSNQDVLDVGCNNGYYMFDFALRCRNVIGIDPVGIFFLQFYFLYKLCGLKNVAFRLLGIQDLGLLHKKFDVILCLGVLYHREEPLKTLKMLKKCLKKSGTLILETLIINDESQRALCPYPTYAGMKNVYFIFTPQALRNLAFHAGFKKCELVNLSYTTSKEQRSTDFIHKKSLGDFLPTDPFSGDSIRDFLEENYLDKKFLSKNLKGFSKEYSKMNFSSNDLKEDSKKPKNTIENYPPVCRGIFVLNL